MMFGRSLSTAAMTTTSRRQSDGLRRAAWQTAAASVIAVASLEVATELPSQGRASNFYHALSDNFVTPWLRRNLKPETAHQVAVALAKAGLSPFYPSNAMEQALPLRQTVSFPNNSSSSNIENASSSASKSSSSSSSMSSSNSTTSSWNWSNPVGLASCMDVNGSIVSEMLRLGFGHVEIGPLRIVVDDDNPSKEGSGKVASSSPSHPSSPPSLGRLLLRGLWETVTTPISARAGRYYRSVDGKEGNDDDNEEENADRRGAAYCGDVASTLAHLSAYSIYNVVSTLLLFT